MCCIMGVMINKICLAGCVILDEKGKVLLLHRNAPKRVQWETPGGKIEEREESEKAAVREVGEELGIKVEIVKELGRKDFAEDGYTMEYVWYLAVIKAGEPNVMEKEKFDDLRYFSWEELRAMQEELSPNTRNLVAAYFNNEFDFR